MTSLQLIGPILTRKSIFSAARVHFPSFKSYLSLSHSLYHTAPPSPTAFYSVPPLLTFLIGINKHLPQLEKVHFTTHYKGIIRGKKSGKLQMGRHSCCYKQKLRKGLWSPEEDEKLLRHITKYGHGCWSSVPKQAGSN